MASILNLRGYHHLAQEVVLSLCISGFYLGAQSLIKERQYRKYLALQSGTKINESRLSYATSTTRVNDSSVNLYYSSNDCTILPNIKDIFYGIYQAQWKSLNMVTASMQDRRHLLFCSCETMSTPGHHASDEYSTIASCCSMLKTNSPLRK